MAIPIDPCSAGAEIIRTHLRDLLADGIFASSLKLSRFLEFTVERTLAGEGDGLKEYRIGVDIYGRPPTYDPRTDPIVRVEARRLRTKLSQFYEGKGANCPVQIDYPKGSYVPVFRFSGQPSGAPSRPKFTRKMVVSIAAAGALIALLALAIGRRRHPSTLSPEPLLTKITAEPGLNAWPALSADGQLVAYGSDRGSEGELHIWVQRLDGQRAIRLTHQSGSNTESSFSPDGKTVAYRSERDGGSGIFLVSSQGGQERLLVPLGRRPRFSPDGRWLAYWIRRDESDSGNDELFVLPLVGGGTPRRIAPDFSSATLPNWSPDGKKILFRGTSGSPETLCWYIADLEGGRPICTDAINVLMTHHMIQALPWDYRPYAWGDEGLVFSARLGEVTNIWQVRPSINPKVSGALRRLTTGTAFDAFPAIASPNGKLILAFAETVASINIWTLPVETNTGKVTGDLKGITDELATWVEDPSVSADGTKIVHLWLRSKETNNLCLRDLTTGRTTNVFPRPLTTSFPKMSSDGTLVAYRSEEGTKEAVYVFQTDTQQPEIHARRVCADCGRPMDWLKDNRKFLFATSRGRSSIGLFDIDSGEKAELLSDARRELEAARLSPSNEWIAFCARRDDSGASRIFITKFYAANKQVDPSWIDISGSSEKDLLPGWSPDGNLLYLLSERDGFRCIWAQRLDSISKRPFGAPFVVRHFHQLRHSLLRTILSPPRAVGLSVAADRLFFSLDDMTGNIWTAKW